MYSRIIKLPKDKSFFLFGPRGTGKTTLVKKNYPKSIYLDLLEAELFNKLLADPGRLQNYIPVGYKDYIIIDEVQRVPELLNEVHRLIEKSGYRFILTGSSARKLRKKGHNLLAGRALTYFLYPLTAVELGRDFDIEQSIHHGHLPSVFNQSNKQKYLESYVKTYLEEEIAQEGLTRNLSTFARFLETASFSQGSVLNTSAIAREASIERKVVENYFNIIESLLIGYRLPVFTKKAKRRLISHPKFYFFDTGIYRILRPKGPLDSPEMIDGIALESLFFQDLTAVNHSLDLGYKFYYYRTAVGVEVDFVLYGIGGIHAFEIKRTGQVSQKMLNGLRQFQKDYPQAKCYFLYGGSRKMYIDGVKIIPIKEAFLNLVELLT